MKNKKKSCRSTNYNYKFDMETGFFARWGKTMQDDPEFCPFGPEILDIEVSTICHNECSFCYKSNTSKGTNMSIATFKTIFDKLPKTLTQVAFGIGSIDANPDLWKMMEHCIENDVVPNITINGNRMTPYLYDKLATYCGAVAVSLYDFDTCYNAIAELSKRDKKQWNIHCLLSKETYANCLKVMEDSIHDPRLENLNAIVFLWLKPKGDRNYYNQMTSRHDFETLIEYALDNHVAFGFDSCTASNFLQTIENKPSYESIKMMVDPCESTLFSYYINVDGIGFPCSFSENVYPYTGLDIVHANNFIKDIWNNEQTVEFRKSVISNKDRNGCRMCPIYDLRLKECAK